MSVKNPKRIVVDTSIIRAAGYTEHPVSQRCREFLLCILTVCHRVAMTQDLNRELRTIVWINPVNEEEHSLEWLKIGAKPEKERQLGYNRKE